MFPLTIEIFLPTAAPHDAQIVAIREALEALGIREIEILSGHSPGFSRNDAPVLNRCWQTMSTNWN